MGAISPLSQEFERNVCVSAIFFVLLQCIIIKGESDMELQTVRIGRENIVPSGAKVDGISIRRSGIAKVLWRKMNRDVPRSEVIKDGVNIYKG